MPGIEHYKVLTSDLISVADREKILTQVINIKNPAQPLPANFSINYIDHFQRVAIVTWHGVEVLLLFKRMTSELKVFPVEVAPRAFLKNANEAWVVIRLLEIYPGLSMADRIAQLEDEVKQKTALINSLNLENEELTKYGESLAVKKRKKDAKTATPIKAPQILSSEAINKALLKISPIKVQECVRALFLWSQSFFPDGSYGLPPKPDTLPKYAKKIDRHLTRITKMLQRAKQDKEIVAYQVRPPKVRKKKVVIKKGKKKKKP